MSMGFLVPEDTPMIWRRPMVMSALQQMLREAGWRELDIMAADLPSGTGDVRLMIGASNGGRPARLQPERLA